MKKHFNKEVVMTKKGNEVFRDSTNCWICDNDYVDDNVKVRDDCNITGKYIEALHMEIIILILNQITKVLSYFTT